ncbi:hypothetical protein [Nostoc sp. UCD121]|nr:hypothetical protein [Nostoc sp. UCD121]
MNHNHHYALMEYPVIAVINCVKEFSGIRNPGVVVIVRQATYQ